MEGGLYYLSNGDMFSIAMFTEYFIFVKFCKVQETISYSNLRWVKKDIFKSKHLEGIYKYLNSENLADRNIGKIMLSQALKVQIDGEIVGRNE